MEAVAQLMFPLPFVLQATWGGNPRNVGREFGSQLANACGGIELVTHHSFP